IYTPPSYILLPYGCTTTDIILYYTVGNPDLVYTEKPNADGDLGVVLQATTVHELEESCVRQGGLCVMKSDCPPENIVFLSGTLCPKQQHLGVTCCYL
ncbi:hypothetical protein HW555_013188, partial [Spodoptera exigua]